MTTQTPYPLVSYNSLLNLLKLTPDQLNHLLKALCAQTYQVETRRYVQRSTKKLICNLLALRFANTPMQDYLNALDEMTVLYRCPSCGELQFFTERLSDEQLLTHICLLARRPRSNQLGRFELVGSAPLHRLIEQHCSLFGLPEHQLALVG